MSQYNTSGTKGWRATSAIATAGLAVKLASGEVVVATAGTDKIVGILENAVAAAEEASVRLRSAQGTAKVKAGGTIAVGDLVTATTAGKLITTTTAGDQVVGIALEAGVVNDLIEVMLSVSKF